MPKPLKTHHVKIIDISDFLDSVKNLAKLHSEIKNITLFGSFARGDASQISDIDLAFSLADSSKWGFIAQKIREHAKTLRKLDLVCFEKISGKFKQKILDEGIIIYEQSQSKTKSSKL